MTPTKTNQQDRAVVLIAAGVDYDEVARTVGTSPRTLARWLADDSFRQRVEDLRTHTQAHVKRHLEALTTEATGHLRDMMADKDTAKRLCAVSSVLGLHHRPRGTHARLSRLERIADQLQATKKAEAGQR